MTSLATGDWQLVGSTSNADFYAIDREVLAVVPRDNTGDDESTARESLAFQNGYWRGLGHRGAAVIFMDPVLEQTGGARAVYANETADSLSTCFALVGETPFGHAAASVFEGLARPGIPTRVFHALAEAVPWIEGMNKARGGRV